MNDRTHTLGRLRAIVHELYDARYDGADAARIMRAQGLADGYMRALSDMGVARDSELLALIDKAQRQAAAKYSKKYASSTVPSETAANLA